MSDEENQENGENEYEKTKLQKPKSIDKSFGKPDSSIKLLQWDIKSKLSKECKVKISNTYYQFKGPWFQYSKIKFDFKQSPFNASATIKPFSNKEGDVNNADFSLTGSYKNVKLNFKIKEKGELGLKVTQNLDFISNVLKAKLEYNWIYKNLIHKSSFAAQMTYHTNPYSHYFAQSRMDTEAIIKCTANSSSQGQANLQCILNICKNPPFISTLNTSTLDQQNNEKEEKPTDSSNDQEEQKSEENDGQKFKKKKKQNVLYKIMVNDKLVWNKNNPYAKTSFVFENTKNSAYYQLQGTVKKDENFSLDLMTRQQIFKNLSLGLMGSIFSDRNILQRKLQFNVQIDKIKYIGKMFMGINLKNAMLKVNSKLSKNFTSQFVIRKPFRSPNFNYGFKFTYNM